MRQKRKRYFLTSFLAVLFVGIGFWGYATSQTPVTESPAKIKTAELAIKENNIPIQGAITHVHEPDESSSTIIDIVIGKEFTGNLIRFKYNFLGNISKDILFTNFRKFIQI